MMKKFKTKKKRRFSKIFVYIFIVFISFIITMSFLIKKREIDPEKFIKSFLNTGFNHQINNYTYNTSNNISNPLSLLEYSLDFNFIKPVDNNKLTANYVEKVNKNMNNPLIYIYNTHDQEEYKSNFQNVYNIVPNVKLASYILQEKLEDVGISSVVETNSIKKILNDNSWIYSDSYKASRILLEQTKMNYPSIKYFIDIHRDSSKYDKTTIEINNIKYAKVLFIVGLEHEKYEENLKLAESLNNILNQKINGISKGIYKKEGPGVNGIYNQDFSSNSILIEVGGVDNSIDEVANTIHILGESIYSYIKEQK